MIRRLIILLLIVGLFGQDLTQLAELTNKKLNIINQNRDNDCEVDSVEFCNENDPLFSPLNCDWVCRESHNRTIQKHSSSQYYSSISNEEASNLYSAIIDHLENDILDYECLRRGIYGKDMDIINHHLDFNLHFIIEDINCGWWDWDDDETFDNYPNYAESYKKGWGHFSINAADSDSTISIHVNYSHKYWANTAFTYIINLKMLDSQF